MSAIACLAVELLEQATQLQRLGLAVVRHDRRGAVVLAVDPPAEDRWRWQTALAARALFAPRALRSRLALLARAGDQLPAFAGTGTGIVGTRDKRAAVQGDDAELRIALAIV